MIKYLVALLLLASAVKAEQYLLTPLYLPTGFEGQYYEVRYRVRGLPHAAFTFSNLPDFLQGTEQGVLKGTPDLSGTFRFKVAFTDDEGNQVEEEDVISITASPHSAASDKQNKEVVELIVTTALNSWIYRVNDKIDVKLESKGGKLPIAWNYRGLPKGLYGDSHGRIRGSVKSAGLYSFSASCGDAVGQKASSYYTLNVQPGSLIKSTQYLIQPITSLTFLTETLELFTTLIRLNNNKLLLIALLLMLCTLLLAPRLSPRLNNPPRQRLSLL